MRPGTRIGIILAVLLAVAAVLYAKNQPPSTPAASSAAPQTSEAAATVPQVPLPRLVDVGSHKCVPCKMMAPILDELRRQYAGQMEVVFIDIFEEKEQAKALDVQIIPTQIFYDASGQERFRHEGFLAKDEILNKWRELGVTLQAPTTSTTPTSPGAAE